MNVLGVHLTVLMGSEAGPPRPVPISIVEALKDVQVTHADQGPSGFQITFQIGRSGPWDLKDYALLREPLLRPFNRVVLIVRFAVLPIVLMDGIITNVQVSPSEDPGASTLTVTGEDVSVMMDLEERSQSFPAMPDYVIVNQIIGQYLRLGLTPPIPPEDPRPLIPPNPTEEIPQQATNMTDRRYLQELAARFGFLFYVTPGPAPTVNTVHWGPPVRVTAPQKALSVNMGPGSNVRSINFSYDALRPHEVRYVVDPEEEETDTITTPSFSRMIPLARNRAQARKKTSITAHTGDLGRYDAQSAVDQSFDSVVTASGELDALRYERLLEPRALVGLRGAGDSYDGLYYVQRVSHRLSKGSYTQSFTLTREGTGTLTPFVMP